MRKDIQMWIAFDENGNDVFIENALPGKDYFCPSCNSIVHCRAKDSNIITEHFYHLNKDNCDGGESALHRYWKTHLVEIGEQIELPKIGKIRCEDKWVERATKDGKYRPDLIIKTNHPKYKFIILEIYNTNKKIVEEYRAVWDKYKYPVYEIDIKKLSKDKLNFLSCVKLLYSEEKYSFEENSKRTIKKLYKVIENESDYDLTYNQLDKSSLCLNKIYRIFKRGIDKPNKTNLTIIERDLNNMFVDRKFFFDFTLPLKNIVNELKNYI